MKLETAGYVRIEKEFRGKKPHSMVRLTGRAGRRFESTNAESNEC